MASSFAAPSIGGDGTVYLTADIPGKGPEATAFAVEPATGIARWTFAVPGAQSLGSSSPPIGADGTLYLRERDRGIVYAVRQTIRE